MAPDSRHWLAHLELFGIKLGLESIRAIAGALGHPENAAPVLHIAGTNGKGSVSAMAAHALTCAGHVTGRYTSPHLVRVEERFAIDGRDVSSRDLDAALERVREVVTRLRARGILSVEPTYFEATTAAACLLFQSARVDAAVFEVGLGGRHDATNIVSPLVTAITSIARDHEAHLGSTLPAIAAEKAGIIKPGIPVVIGPLPADARAVVEHTARERRAPAVTAFDGVEVVARSHAGRYEVTIDTPAGRYGPLLLALPGRHQVENAVVAVRLLESAAEQGLRVSADAIASGLSDVRWRARLEALDTPRGRILIDGAHNPAGARALASYLEEAHPGGLPIVVGIMSDKAVDEILAALTPHARPMILTRAPGARAANPSTLAEQQRRVAPDADIVVEPDIGAALDMAWQRGASIAVAGSLYLAGDVLARLAGEAAR